MTRAAVVGGGTMGAGFVQLLARVRAARDEDRALEVRALAAASAPSGRSSTSAGHAQLMRSAPPSRRYTRLKGAAALRPGA